MDTLIDGKVYIKATERSLNTEPDQHFCVTGQTLAQKPGDIK